MYSYIYIWLMAAGLGFSTPNTQNPSPEEVLHPFYVSVTEINHNPQSKSLEISCKIFTDDFEVALNNSFATKIDLFKPADKAEVEKLMANYMKNHLLIFIDGKRVDFQFVGYERESEAIWSYFEVVNCPEPKTMELKNAILYDSFKEQINLMHVTVKGKRKSGKLDFPKTALLLDFQEK